MIFNILADKYDEWYDSEDGKPLYLSELECLRSLIGDPQKPILEIGVGTGRFAMHFHDVIGVDISLNMLKKAKERGVKVIYANGEKLPFENKKFGCILLVVTLCFLDNPIKVLQEAKRVLKDSGILVIGIIPKESPWGKFYQNKKIQGHPFYSIAKFYSLEDVKFLLQKTGFFIKTIKSTLFQSPTTKPYKIEKSIYGYSKKAGFICIKCSLK